MNYQTDANNAFAAAQKCIKFFTPFMLYRHPGENNFYFWAQDENKTTDFDNTYSAVIHPWSGDEKTIYAHLTASEVNAKSYSCTGSCLKEIENTQTSKEEYITGINNVINRLRIRGGKTVISRVIIEPILKSHIASLAKVYFEYFKNAYCLLYLTPDGICWLTASPECLYDADATQVKTMALAGTRTIEHADEPWDEKNLEEHRLVADYVDEKLSSMLGCTYTRHPLTTLSYGKIQHLLTPFTAKCEEPSEIGRIMHPTPAVCGFPLEDALSDIKDIELHNRHHYAGYVELKLNERQIGIVNLRCAQMSDKLACLYAGGGITALSSPEKEWEETSNKASILIKVINSQ